MRRAPALLCGVILVTACAVRPAPPRIAGLELVNLSAGPEARQRVRALHGPGAAVPERTTIACYSAPGREILLYRSTFTTEEDASASLAAMLEAIGSRRTPFRITAGGPAGAVLTGLGREHAVWVDGRDLLWLEATPGLLEAALSDLGAGPPVPGGRPPA